MAATNKLASTRLLEVISNEVKQWATSSDARLSFLGFSTKLEMLIQRSEYAYISTIMLTNTITITDDLLVALGMVDGTTTATSAQQKVVQLMEEHPALTYHAIAGTATVPFPMVTEATMFQILLHRIGTVQAKNVLRQISEYWTIAQNAYEDYLRLFDAAHGLRSVAANSNRTSDSSGLELLSSVSASSNRLLHQTYTQLLEMVLKLNTEVAAHRRSSEREREIHQHEREMAATERYMNMQRWEQLFKHLPELLLSITGGDDPMPLNLSTNAPSECGTMDKNRKRNNCSIGLFAMVTPGDWYLMCRQEVGWQKAKRRLIERNAKECYKWEKVIASKREMTILLNHNVCSDKWQWLPRLNILRCMTTPLPTDEELVDMITPLLYPERVSPIDYVIPKLEV